MLIMKFLSALLLLAMMGATIWLTDPLTVVRAADSGWRNPSADAPDPGGDDDGFEELPAEAYADDGDYARNVNGPADRQRYFNFGFDSLDIPPDALITGIEVRLDGWADSASNSPYYEVELSWNGGASWTALRSTPTLSTAENSYYLGDPYEAWGRSWSVGEFSEANFRLRITSRATGLFSGFRDFFLDWVAVRVHYATANIAGRVWDDANRNGAQDAGETGLSGVDVTVYQDDGDAVFEGGGQDPLVDFATTNTAGAYSLGPLLEGRSYWVDVAAPADYALTTPPEPRLVALPDGNSIEVNFGYASTAANPALDIAKTPDTQVILSGSTVTFTLAVTNTGDVPLTNVMITDPLTPNCAHSFALLTPGQSARYACTRANVTADFTNSASVRGTPPLGADVTASDTAIVDVIRPALDIAKTPDTQAILSGSTVTFTIAVTNTGDVALTGVSVSDALAPNCDRAIGSLNSGQRTSYTCTRSGVTADFTNTAIASGASPLGGTVSDSDTAFVDVVGPGIDIAKTPEVQTIISGSTVTFTIAVTNTGDVPLANVTISDVLAPNCQRTFATLAVGQKQSYTCTLPNVTAEFTNTATVSCTPPVGSALTDTDTARVKLDRTQSCPAGMTAYWNLDETSGPVYDNLYGERDGECAGQCPGATTGRVSGGQTFDSNTGISIATNPGGTPFDWGVNASFSIELWMKADSVNSCALNNEVIVGREDSSTGLHWWVGCLKGGLGAFYLRDKSGALLGVISNTDVTDGAWRHIVAVRDASTNELRLFIDGAALSAPAAYGAGFDSPTAALDIGWLNRSHGYHFHGVIDEVALYSRTLSVAEIQRHHTEGLLAGRGYCESATPAPGIAKIYLPVVLKSP
ncbi:MAG TPA: LamG-like jellyroll fold domain-containing protein [Anaerolineae bacterium]|nr:LamG-like jellyroll fold domain-containing protein [Anaerolineae bacterium]